MTLQPMYSPAPGANYTAVERAWMIAGLMVLALAVMLCAEHALAAAGGSTGTGSDILSSVYDLLKAAVTGTVGRVLTLLIVIVGIAAGIMSQSLLAFAVGLGAGIGLFFAPDIIDALSTATVMMDPTMMMPLAGG